MKHWNDEKLIEQTAQCVARIQERKAAGDAPPFRGSSYLERLKREMLKSHRGLWYWTPDGPFILGIVWEKVVRRATAIRLEQTP